MSSAQRLGVRLLHVAELADGSEFDKSAQGAQIRKIRAEEQEARRLDDARRAEERRISNEFLAWDAYDKDLDRHQTNENIRKNRLGAIVIISIISALILYSYIDMYRQARIALLFLVIGAGLTVFSLTRARRELAAPRFPRPTGTRP